MRIKATLIVCIAFGACLIFSSSSLASYCFEQWACLETIEYDNRIEFWVHNKKPFPFTASLKINPHQNNNEHPTVEPVHRTLVLQGKERKKAIELIKQNGQQSIAYEDSFYWTPGDMHAHHDQVLYQLPYAEDAYYRVVQGFGGGYSHQGASRYAVDFAMPVGTAVHAAREGIVIDLTEYHSKGGASRRFAPYANFVTILHSDGTLGEYYHLQQYGVEVELGEFVATGDLIGYSGNTGFSSLPHLHFAVYRAKSFGNYESLPFRFHPR